MDSEIIVCQICGEFIGENDLEVCPVCGHNLKSGYVEDEGD